MSPKGDSERVERVDREVAPVFRSFERIEASRQRGGAIGRSGAYARFGSLHASGHVRTRAGGVARDGLESASPTHDARETHREDRVMAEETTFWPDFDEDGANEDQAIDDFLNVLLEIDTDTVKNQGGTPGRTGIFAARRSHARRSIHRELHRNVVLAGRDERARVRRRNLARPRRRWRDGSTHAASAGAAGERADGRTRAPNVRPDGRHRWRRRSSRHRRRRVSRRRRRPSRRRAPSSRDGRV